MNSGGDTDIGFHENGNLKSGWLAKDQTIENMTYAKGTNIYFFDDGRVEYGHLAGKQVYHDLGLITEVQFYPNGGLKLGHLSSKQTIQGLVLEKTDQSGF